MPPSVTPARLTTEPINHGSFWKKAPSGIPLDPTIPEGKTPFPTREGQTTRMADAAGTYIYVDAAGERVHAFVPYPRVPQLHALNEAVAS